MKNSLEKQIEKLLLSPKEMNEVYQKLHKQKFKYPYFYKIVKHNQHFYFLGPHHIFNPKDPQVKTIKKLWNEFLEATKKKGCIALIEGGKRPLFKSEKIALEKHGEPGLMTLFAHRENIMLISPEPEELKITNYLVNKFGKKKTIYTNFARDVAQWNRYSKKPDFEKYIKRYLVSYEKLFRWKEFDFTTSNMVRLHDQYHDHKFDRDNYECFNRDSNPIHSPVSGAASKLRDTHLLKIIYKLWHEGKNIFVVFGSGHAITLEHALKKLLT